MLAKNFLSPLDLIVVLQWVFQAQYRKAVKLVNVGEENATAIIDLKCVGRKFCDRSASICRLD